MRSIRLSGVGFLLSRLIAVCVLVGTFYDASEFFPRADSRLVMIGIRFMLADFVVFALFWWGATNFGEAILPRRGRSLAMTALAVAGCGLIAVGLRAWLQYEWTAAGYGWDAVAADATRIAPLVAYPGPWLERILLGLMAVGVANAWLPRRELAHAK